LTVFRSCCAKNVFARNGRADTLMTELIVHN
jgi:hypothetical protein